MNKLTPILLITIYILIIIFAIKSTNNRDRKLDEVYKACAPVVDIKGEPVCTK